MRLSPAVADVTDPEGLRQALTDAVAMSGPVAIVVANAGALGFRIMLHGRSAHAARRWEGIDTLDLVAADLPA